MGFDFSTVTVLVCLLLQCVAISEGHRKNLEEQNNLNSHHHHSSPSSTNMDPSLNLFFHHNTLKPGYKLPIYFPTKNLSITPHLLSREESDSIPFQSSQLSQILEKFSFKKSSKQALAMKSTLHHCEFPPLKGEEKFCATSLESMLDSVKSLFGPNSHFKVLTTNYLSEKIAPLQNYTIAKQPLEIYSPKIIACHTLPYPYLVFYCHGQVSDNMLYKVLLEGDDGAKVEAAAMCHMNTSQWDPQHVAFTVLNTMPGGAPVCHFFPKDNLVWITELENES